MKVKWVFETAEWRNPVSYKDVELIIDFTVKCHNDESYRFIEECLYSPLSILRKGIAITDFTSSSIVINYTNVQYNGVNTNLPVDSQRTPIKFSAKFKIGDYRNIRDIMDVLITVLIEEFSLIYGGAIYSIEMPLEVDPETFFGVHVLETASEEQSPIVTLSAEEES